MLLFANYTVVVETCIVRGNVPWRFSVFPGIWLTPRSFLLHEVEELSDACARRLINANKSLYGGTSVDS